MNKALEETPNQIQLLRATTVMELEPFWMNAELEVVVSVKRVRACVGQSQEVEGQARQRSVMVMVYAYPRGGKAARMIGACVLPEKFQVAASRMHTRFTASNYSTRWARHKKKQGRVDWISTTSSQSMSNHFIRVTTS